MVQVQPVRFPETPLVRTLSQHSQPSLCLLTPSIAAGRPTPLSGQISSITTTLHQIGWLVSGNCIGERTGAKLSCKLAYSREGIPKNPFMPTVVVILAAGLDCRPKWTYSTSPSSS